MYGYINTHIHAQDLVTPKQLKYKQIELLIFYRILKI